jgi:hypothetical protein
MTLPLAQLLDPWEGEILSHDDLVKRLTKAATDPDVYTRSWVATHPSTPVNILVTLATDPKEIVRAQLTMNESCPEEVLLMLFEDRSPAVLTSLINNWQIPEDTVRSWIQNEDWVKRAAVGGWRHLSLSDAEILAHDDDSRVRYVIQANHHWTQFSRDVILSKPLESITRDECDAAICAGNDLDVYLKLAHHPDRELRLELAKSGVWCHITDQMFEVLALDEDVEIKLEALKTLEARSANRKKSIQ